MRKLLYLFLPLIISLSCGTSKVKNVIRYKLTVVIDKPINNNLTESDLQNLFFGMSSDNCSENIFVPSITILRVDLDKIVQQDINFKLKSKAAPDAIKNWLVDSLKSLKIDKQLKEAASSGNNWHKNVLEVININAGTEVVSYNKNPDNNSMSLGGKRINNLHYTDSIMSFFLSKLCYENNDSYKPVDGKEFILLYNLKGDREVVGPEPDPDSLRKDDCNGEFCELLKKKLLAIGICDHDKVYEDRFQLAKEFVSNYFTNQTQVELLNPEGFQVDTYIGSKAKDYIFSLAEADRCVSNIRIPTFTTLGTDERKVKYIRIVEYNDKSKITSMNHE
jgi:hypothetical protein